MISLPAFHSSSEISLRHIPEVFLGLRFEYLRLMFRSLVSLDGRVDPSFLD